MIPADDVSALCTQFAPRFRVLLQRPLIVIAPLPRRCGTLGLYSRILLWRSLHGVLRPRGPASPRYRTSGLSDSSPGVELRELIEGLRCIQGSDMSPDNAVAGGFRAQRAPTEVPNHCIIANYVVQRRSVGQLTRQQSAYSLPGCHRLRNALGQKRPGSSRLLPDFSDSLIFF